MVDGFLGPWQTIVLAPRGGKIACVFDEIRMINLNGNQEFDRSARYPDAYDMKRLYYPIY